MLYLQFNVLLNSTLKLPTSILNTKLKLKINSVEEKQKFRENRGRIDVMLMALNLMPLRTCLVNAIKRA